MEGHRTRVIIEVTGIYTSPSTVLSTVSCRDPWTEFPGLGMIWLVLIGRKCSTTYAETSIADRQQIVEDIYEAQVPRIGVALVHNTPLSTIGSQDQRFGSCIYKPQSTSGL